VTRQDLSAGYQATQLAHALADFIIAHPEVAKSWHTTSNSLITLTCSSEQELHRLLSRATSKGIRHFAFREPDLGYALTAIALEPGDETKRLCSSLPLALKHHDPEAREREAGLKKLVADMSLCEQTKGMSVLDHGYSVWQYTADLINHLRTGSELKFEWRLPEWLYEHKESILKDLFHDLVIEHYAIMHDCGKPYCLVTDEDGKRHFPDHALVSSETYSEFEEADWSRTVLIGYDMFLHTASAEELAAQFEKTRGNEYNDLSIYLPTLMLVALAEIHSNAAMFGGIESTSFKIKWKHLTKRGRQAIDLLGYNSKSIGGNL
jgi:hypothetical protein